MHALLLDQPGSLRQLRVGEHPAPQAGPEEIRIRVRAAGLNHIDYRLAAKGHSAWKWPHVLGLDVAGEVDQLGENANGFSPGDRVFYFGDFSRPGGFAEHAVAPAHVIVRIPRKLGFEQAAALPYSGFTAWQAVDRLGLVEGQTLLILGAAGGVGGFAIQLARRLGVRVIAVCTGSDIDYLKGLGADEAIDNRSEDIPSRVRELTDDKGVDAALDTVSPQSARTALQLLAFHAALACTAGLPDLKALQPFTITPSLHEVALSAFYSHGNRQDRRRMAETGEQLASLAAQGEIDPTLAKIVSLDEIPRGLEDLASRRIQGKIVARIP